MLAASCPMQARPRFCYRRYKARGEAAINKVFILWNAHAGTLELPGGPLAARGLVRVAELAANERSRIRSSQGSGHLHATGHQAVTSEIARGDRATPAADREWKTGAGTLSPQKNKQQKKKPRREPRLFRQASVGFTSDRDRRSRYQLPRRGRRYQRPRAGRHHNSVARYSAHAACNRNCRSLRE